MTVTERLFDNAWFVAHAAPAVRQELAADVTRTWMDWESAREDANRVRTVAGVSPGRFALALSTGNAVQAEYHRAKMRAEQAARCTDIVAGHAFTISRSRSLGDAMTVDIASCTLLRRATLTVAGRDQAWIAQLEDPQSHWAAVETVTLGPDPWESLHWACDWIVTGRH